MEIPGTVLTGSDSDLLHIEQLLDSLFLAGGMTRSQIVNITGLEPYMVQNWVKRGFLSSPINKKYSKRQLCRILNICALKNALPMERICGLLTYINGQLDDDSDDLIDDVDLYCMFVKLMVSTTSFSPENLTDQISKMLDTYHEPVPGAKNRVSEVLSIMILAYESSKLRLEAESLLNKI